MLIGQTPRGPLGGPQSTPKALRGKKFCLQKGGSNNSECFDLPRSTIVKNTLKKKNFHPDQFLCENRICRGFRLFCQCQFWNETSIIYFSWLTCSIWRESEGVLVKKIPGGPPGGAKVPPGPYAVKNFVSENGVQTTQNALIYLNPLSWKTLLWKKTQIFYPD